jgi:hypothetical protein
MSKFYVRNQPVISRDTEAREHSSKRPDWFEEFSNSIANNSTEPKKDQTSTFDQINRILGNKSKYSNVGEAVLDMQKRTGLYELLKKRAEMNTNMPEIFSEVPDMRIFIDNYVGDRPGVSVEAVVNALLKVRDVKNKLPEHDDVPLDVRQYINDKIAESDMLHPKNESNMQLGKLDVSIDEGSESRDNSPFAGCEPMKNK